MRTKFFETERRHCEECQFLRYVDNRTKDKVYCKLSKDSGMELTYPYPSKEFEKVGEKAKECFLFK